eukprot:jgi/Botrbrau1/20783/Bobra.0156s0014.1
MAGPGGGEASTRQPALSEVTERARAAFPYFNPSRNNPIFMENAGGSQAATCVVDAMCDYMRDTYVQLGAEYELSRRATATVDRAHRVVHDMMGAGEAGQVVLGPSSSQLYANVADAYRRAKVVGPGDEIVVQESGHEANIGPWVRLAEATGATLIWWRFLRQPPFSSPISDLEALLSPRTKVVAMSHVSNLLGEVADLPAIVELLRRQEAGGQPPHLCVDGVAYAPHLAMDVAAWGVHWYGFSLYKTYGPHMAALYGSTEALAAVETGAPNHYFLPRTKAQYAFELGGVAHEAAAGVAALPQYFALLAGALQDAEEELGRNLVEGAFGNIADMEQPLQDRLLDYLRSKPGVTIVGPPVGGRGRRVPTISFVVRDKSSADVAKAMVDRGVAVRNGHNYAHRLALGLTQAGVCHDPEDGVVRVSMLHYNTISEVEHVIRVLEEIL